jgi:hypothetical protein
MVNFSFSPMGLAGLQPKHMLADFSGIFILPSLLRKLHQKTSIFYQTTKNLATAPSLVSASLPRASGEY